MNIQCGRWAAIAVENKLETSRMEKSVLVSAKRGEPKLVFMDFFFLPFPEVDFYTFRRQMKIPSHRTLNPKHKIRSFDYRTWFVITVVCDAGKMRLLWFRCIPIRSRFSVESKCRRQMKISVRRERNHCLADGLVKLNAMKLFPVQSQTIAYNCV